MTMISRYALTVLAGTLLLSACADKNTQPSHTTSSTTTSRTHVVSSTSTSTNPPLKPHIRIVTPEPPLPANTGIAACDNYLSTYLACHRAAHIYAPDQLDNRYQIMRTSLLRDSQDPDIRPQLGARCASLAEQLHEALHGKPCDSEPAAPSSSTP